MEHVAIMNKKWQLIPKILNGQKTIESRWYISKRAPWKTINEGELVYFKNAGEKVGVQAKVEKIRRFENLNKDKIREVLRQYGLRIGFGSDRIEENVEFYKDKKYCILIWLREAHEITPFKIDKRGFGTGAAWLSIDSVGRIRL